MGIYDFEKMADNYNIFMSFKTLSKFILKFGKHPQNWNEKDSE